MSKLAPLPSPSGMTRSGSSHWPAVTLHPGAPITRPVAASFSAATCTARVCSAETAVVSPSVVLATTRKVKS